MLAPTQPHGGTTVTPSHLKALREFKSGNICQAKRILKADILRNRNNGRAWEVYGLVHHAAGNYPLAVAAFERAARMVVLRSDSRVTLANAYAKTQRPQLALKLLSDALSQSRSAALLLQVGVALDCIGRPELSIRACSKVLRLHPKNAQAYYDLSYYCGRCNYPASTTERLAQRALKCEPDNAKYRLGLAEMLYRGDKLDAAYELVRNLGSTLLSRIVCGSSLEWLTVLYRRANDERRLLICHQRLVEIRLRGCGLGC